MIRFPPQERVRRFGVEGNVGYSAALDRHRQAIIAKLVGHANRFTVGIKDNFHCLPAFLSTLIRRMFACTEGNGGRGDLGCLHGFSFQLLHLPRYCGPRAKRHNRHTQLPISNIARFNLMQVA